MPAINLQRMYSITFGKFVKKGLTAPTCFSQEKTGKIPGTLKRIQQFAPENIPKSRPKMKGSNLPTSSSFSCELADSFREGKFLKISISRTASNSQGKVRHESLHLSTMSSTQNSVKNGSKIGWSLLGMVL